MQNSIRAMIALSFAGVVGCEVVATTNKLPPTYQGDAELVVRWNVDGAEAAAACTTYGIAQFRVVLTALADNAKLPALDYACGTWNTGTELYGLARGGYQVDVDALDSSGKAIASPPSKRIDLPDAAATYTVDIAFAKADFGNTGGTALVSLDWVINGTVDGSPTGASYDTCEEVGAQSVEVTINGETETYPCSAGGGDFDQLAPGAYQATLVLLDSKKSQMTQPITVNVTAADKPDITLVDFPYTKFRDPWLSTTTGDFIFEVKYQGGVCASTNPPVELRVVVLDLDGKPVVGKACPVGNPDPKFCADLASATFAPCIDGPQVIRGLVWGEYEITLSGAEDLGPDICWELRNKTVLVGAGTDNPRKTFDLPRIKTSGNCS